MASLEEGFCVGMVCGTNDASTGSLLEFLPFLNVGFGGREAEEVTIRSCINIWPCVSLLYQRAL